MKIRVNPYERVWNGKSYFYACIYVDNVRITDISGAKSVSEARELGNEVAEQLRAGTLTIEQLKSRPRANPKRLIHGKTLTEWLQKFGITKQSLYKSARRYNLTTAQAIRRRLPPSEWEDFDSKA